MEKFFCSTKIVANNSGSRGSATIDDMSKLTIAISQRFAKMMTKAKYAPSTYRQNRSSFLKNLLK